MNIYISYLDPLIPPTIIERSKPPRNPLADAAEWASFDLSSIPDEPEPLPMSPALRLAIAKTAKRLRRYKHEHYSERNHAWYARQGDYGQGS